MAREIKFRAYSYVNKKIWPVRSILEPSRYCPDGSVKLTRINNMADDGEVDITLVELMQYTGLKDKNDKEIYEGDIIQCTHWLFDGNEVEENFIARVGFKNGSFTLEDIDSRFYSNYTGEENGKGICWIGDISYCEDDYEIIGNIYENPELIEKDQA